MALTPKTYRTVATSLWVAFGVLAGLTVGVYLGVEPRVQVFMVALGGGLVLLVRANTFPENDSSGEVANPPAEVLQLPAPKAVPGEIDLSPNPVEELLSQPEQLKGDTARQWLDRFLIEQQKK